MHAWTGVKRTVSTSLPASNAPMSCSRRTALATACAGGASTALFRNCATLMGSSPARSSSFTCWRTAALCLSDLEPAVRIQAYRKHLQA